MTPAHQFSSLATTMLGLFLGFAQIAAEDIPDGIIPKDKRQIVGTAATSTTASETSTSTSTSPTTMSSLTSTTESESTTAAETTSATSEPTSVQETATSNTSPTAVESTPTSSEAATSTIPTTIHVTTTNSAGSSVTSRIATSAVTTIPASTSDIVVIGSSTINRSTLSEPTTITSALVASITEASTYTSFWTSDGVAFSSVATTQRVIESTTGFATATVAPSIQDSNGSGSGSGLSASSRRIVGGVVGGIGGAILVGGIAVVAYRIWGKKKRAAVEEKDPYMHSASDSIDAQQRQSTQNGLERYLHPGGQPNTASNF